MLRSLHERTGIILVGKRDHCCHSASSFSEKVNVVVTETSYQMLEVSSLCDWERD